MTCNYYRDMRLVNFGTLMMMAWNEFTEAIGWGASWTHCCCMCSENCRAMSQDIGTYEQWVCCAGYGICCSVEISWGSTGHWKYSVGSEVLQHSKALDEDLHYLSSQMFTVLKTLVQNTQLYSMECEEDEDWMMNLCRIYTSIAFATMPIGPLRVFETLRVRTSQRLST